MEELKSIMEKFVASGWDLISIPAQQWLDGQADKDTLVSAIRQADEECVVQRIRCTSSMQIKCA